LARRIATGTRREDQLLAFALAVETSSEQLVQNFEIKNKTANINVKNKVYYTVVRLTVIKQQISFVVGLSWGSLTPQLTSSYK
jgi:hypothetical protein